MKQALKSPFSVFISKIKGFITLNVGLNIKAFATVSDTFKQVHEVKKTKNQPLNIVIYDSFHFSFNLTELGRL